MFLSLIRGFFISCCAIFLYKKILDVSPSIKGAVLFDICAASIVTLLTYILETYLPPLSIVGLAVVIVCYIMLTYKQTPYKAVAVGVIALGLSLLCYVMAGALVAVLSNVIRLFPRFYMRDYGSVPILRIAAGLIQTLIAFLLFKIPRLKNGMPFLQNVKFDEPCLFVGVILVACTMFIRAEGDIIYCVSAILSFGMLLFLIWRNRLTQMYLLKQEQRNTSRIKRECLALEEEIDAAAYEASKERHKAHRLTVAMQKLRENGVELDTGDPNIPKTFIDAVDVVIMYAAQRAADDGVDFEFTTAGRVKNLVGNVASEEELAVLIGDLLDNALMAVRFSSVKSIRLHIAVSNDTPVIAVSDSGIDFEPETIRHLGLKCMTTHPADGGSGLGLMSVFDILRAYKASFEIDETVRERHMLFVKTVMMCFDAQGQTRIKSRRKEILALRAVRPEFDFQ